MQIVDTSEVLLALGLQDSETETERALVIQSITKAEAAVKRQLKYDPVQRSHTEFYPQMDYARDARQAVWEVNSTEAYLRELGGLSSEELQVRHLPVRSITSLSIDYDGRNGARPGSFSSLSTEGTDFQPNYNLVDSSGNKVCEDGIIRSRGRWPNIAGSVKIVYVAGYTQAELRGQDLILDASPIHEAVVDEAVRRFLKVQALKKSARLGFTAGPLISERMGEYNYQVDASALKKLVGGAWDLLPETVEKLNDFVNYGWALAS